MAENDETARRRSKKTRQQSGHLAGAKHLVSVKENWCLPKVRAVLGYLITSPCCQPALSSAPRFAHNTQHFICPAVCDNPSPRPLLSSAPPYILACGTCNLLFFSGPRIMAFPFTNLEFCLFEYPSAGSLFATGDTASGLGFFLSQPEFAQLEQQEHQQPQLQYFEEDRHYFEHDDYHQDGGWHPVSNSGLFILIWFSPSLSFSAPVAQTPSTPSAPPSPP